MKRIIRILTAVTALLLFFAGTVSADIPTAIFTNVPVDSADLLVRKSVTNSVPGSTGDPDTLFSFHITRNGSPYRNQEYTVKDGNGDPVLQQDSRYPTVHIPWTTTENGDFVLKDGWTATFAYFGRGASYEVYEISIPDGYRQVQPAPGIKYAGTLGHEGSILNFINTYIPPADPQYSRLSIEKAIVWPQDYQIPVTEEYTFQLCLDGQNYAGQACSVMDSAGTILRADVTDQEGCLQLKAGEKAVFVDIPSGIDYQVREYAADGWHVLGSDTQEGSVKGKSTDLVFTNSYASFAVSKKIVGAAHSDQSFQFTLTQLSGKPIAGAAYYLYSDSEHYSQEYLYTDSDGKFNLKAGETAVFIGLEEGITYHIRELQEQGWRLMQPSGSDGYTGTVRYDTAPLVQFVNEQLPENQRLYVSKQVTGEKADEEDTFYCVLELKPDDSEPYQPILGAVYQLQKDDDKTEQHITDKENGTFSLHAGDMVMFEELEKGSYRVREVQMPEGYTLQEEVSVMEGILDQNLYLKLTNLHTPPEDQKGSITIRKKDAEGKNLSGVSFTLTRQSDGTQMEEQSTDEKGEAVFADLEADIYVLTETKTAEGNMLLSSPVIITIPLSLTEDEVQAAGADTTSASYDQSSGLWYFYDLKYEITNHANLEMPMAGSDPYTGKAVIGLVCMAAGLVIMLKGRRTKAYAQI